MTSICGYGESFVNYHIINIENLVTKRRQNCKQLRNNGRKRRIYSEHLNLWSVGLAAFAQK